MKFLFAAYILLFPLLSVAMNKQFEAFRSVEWQRIELENNIQKIIVSNIAPILKSGEYIVNVNVEMAAPPELSPYLGKPQVKKVIRFNDASTSKSKDDYIVFHKLGLEAPVIGADDDDEQKESEFKQWQNFMIQLNQNLNLFQHLQKISVAVKLDNYLGEGTKRTVEEVLNNLQLRYGKVKVQVDITYIDMKELKKEIEKKRVDEKKDFYEWVGRLGNAIGLIVAVLIFGVIAWLLMRKYSELKEKEIEAARLAAAPPRPEPTPEKEEPKDKGPEALDATVKSTTEEEEDGLARFRNQLTVNKELAIFLVKKWIRDEGKLPQSALLLLVKGLRPEELALLFDGLETDERNRWKKILNRPLAPKDLKSIHQFISAQIVQEMILPQAISDKDLMSLLVQLSPEQAASFIRDHKDISSCLVNLMSTKFISSALNYLELEKISEFLSHAEDYTDERINELSEEIKVKLSGYVKSESLSPFIEKIIELLPMVKLPVEKSLHENIYKAGGADALAIAVRTVIPADVILNAKPDTIKVAIAEYPRDKRYELLYLLEGEPKEIYQVVIAPNAKAQDMMKLEFDKIEANVANKTKLHEKKDEIVFEWVEYVRKQVKRNPEVAAPFEKELVDWLQKYVNENPNKPNTLKLVAA